MEGMIINICKFAEVENAHTATDVNPHDIGNDFVAKVAGETDYAPCTGVDVGHNSYLLVGEHIY